MAARARALHHAAARAGAALAAKRNSLPSSHIRCMTTASLRATATTARLWPRFLAIFSPQAFTLHHCCERTSTLGDMPLDVDGIAGLQAPAGEPEVRAHRLRFDEPQRIVDRGLDVNAVTGPTPGMRQ